MTKPLRKAGEVLSGVFLRGLVVVLPITLTIAVIGWFIGASENYLGEALRFLLPGLHYWPGLGIVLSVVLILAVGMLVSGRTFRRLLAAADSLLARIPVVKTIYVSIRDIAAFMSGDSRKGFSGVVAVQVQGMWLIGFVTTEDPKGLPAKTAADKLIGVYLPMSYGIGGYTVYLPKAMVEPLDMSLEDGMRVTMSGGVSASLKRTKD